MLKRAIFFVLALLLVPAQAQPQTWAWDDGTVPYVNTPVEIVERMMRMAEVGKDDYVVDLGSGDGRLVIAAAKRGASGLGVDLDPSLVRLATQNAAKAGVGDRAKFEVKDIFETDLSPATVVTMYLLPDFNAKLLPKFLKLKPGTRIVSHDGGIGDWPPDETLEMKTPEKPVGIGGNSRIDLWIVPANAAGAWSSDLGSHGGTWQFRIGQRYQVLDVRAAAGGRDLLVRNTRLRGEEIKMVITGVVGPRPWHHYFVGQVHGDRIDGQLSISDGSKTRTVPWVATRTK
jgi:SAM-dependent methyltransferase